MFDFLNFGIPSTASVYAVIAVFEENSAPSERLILLEKNAMVAL